MSAAADSPDGWDISMAHVLMCLLIPKPDRRLVAAQGRDLVSVYSRFTTTSFHRIQIVQRRKGANADVIMRIILKPTLPLQGRFPSFEHNKLIYDVCNCK